MQSLSRCENWAICVQINLVVTRVPSIEYESYFGGMKFSDASVLFKSWFIRIFDINIACAEPNNGWVGCVIYARLNGFKCQIEFRQIFTMDRNKCTVWMGSLAYFSRRVKFYSFEAYLCTDSRAASKNYGFWVKVQHSHMKPSTEHSSFAATLEIISKNFALQSFEQRILLWKF